MHRLYNRKIKWLIRLTIEHNVLFIYCRPYCNLCVRRVASSVKNSSNGGNILAQVKPSTRTLVSATRDGIHTKKTNLLILKSIKPQGCLKNVNARTLRVERPFLRVILGPQIVVCSQHARQMGMLSRTVGTVGKFLRVRYLLLTGAVGGGVAANQVCM